MTTREEAEHLKQDHEEHFHDGLPGKVEGCPLCFGPALLARAEKLPNGPYDWGF